MMNMEKLIKRLTMLQMKACDGDMLSITVLQVIDHLTNFQLAPGLPIVSAARNAPVIRELVAKLALTDWVKSNAP